MISSAFAQSAVGGVSGDLMGFLPMIAIIGVFYFLAIRPQMKRQKEHKQMVEALQKVDEIVAASGILGKVTKCGDTYLTLEIATLGDKPVEVQVQRSAVQAILPRGTLKDTF